jgi:hypothetical protein
VFLLEPFASKALHFNLFAFIYFICVLVETMLFISSMNYIMQLNLWYYNHNDASLLIFCSLYLLMVHEFLDDEDIIFKKCYSMDI